MLFHENKNPSRWARDRGAPQRGLRKLCGCSRKNWPKCSHPWHFNYKPRGGKAWRFSLDAEIGQRIESKTEAETLASDIRAAINAGTFVRAADRRKAGAVTPTDTLSVEQLGATYFAKYTSRKSGKPLSRNERYRWNLIMRTSIDRANGTTVRFGELDARTVTRHDVEAFKAAHDVVGSVVVRLYEAFGGTAEEVTVRLGFPVTGVNECDGLERVGLTGRADETVKFLSYGERRQLELALALNVNPKVLLLDEPCAGLSPSERQRFSQLIAALPRAITLIMIEHDIDIALALADRVTVLHHGKIILDGTPNEVQTNALVREVYFGRA